MLRRSAVARAFTRSALIRSVFAAALASVALAAPPARAEGIVTIPPPAAEAAAIPFQDRREAGRHEQGDAP